MLVEYGSESIDSSQSIEAVLTLHKRSRIDKVNAELVTLTYGTIVAQLCRDYESDYVEVNKQLDKMGYNIGLRLIEDYLAKSNSMRRCANFRETAEMISKVLFHLVFRYDDRSRRKPALVNGNERISNLQSPGRFQDLSQHHTDNHKLDRGQ